MKSIIILSRNPNLPSFRYRMQPLINSMTKKGFRFEIITVRDKHPIYRIWGLRERLKRCDAVYIQKMKLMQIETKIIKSYAQKMFFDVDDAIYLKQPKKSKRPIKLSYSRLRKFNATSRAAIFTSVGNKILGDRVIAAGGTPIHSPTGIDTQNYTPMPENQKRGNTIVWVGLPDNLKYLEIVKPAINRLKKKHPLLRLKIISSKNLNWKNFEIENIKWSSEIEKTEVPASDIGVMPLFDDEYSRGKCAFKLLQYMAAGLPCIASPVGANCDVITHGKNGFLASTDADWEEHLDQLLSSEALRQSMGDAGRKFVVKNFNTEMLAEALGESFSKALGNATYR